MKKVSVIRWAVAYDNGIYEGQWLRRKDAVEGHCGAYLFPQDRTPQKLADEWKACKARGDRVVKVKITEL